jgi:hypothetical protein
MLLHLPIAASAMSLDLHKFGISKNDQNNRRAGTDQALVRH